MSKLDEALGADFIPSHVDVPVLLSKNFAAERQALAEAVERARLVKDVRLGQRHPLVDAEAALARFDETVADDRVVFRFRAMPGFEWQALTLVNPPREDVPVDAQYGYNVDAIVVAAAIASGRVLEGDGEEPITPEQWAKVAERLSGWDAGKIADAVFSLNVFDARRRELMLEKKFGATAAS